MEYKICEECGAYLDPGERCDCLRAEIIGQIQTMNETELDSFLDYLKKNTAPGVGSTEDGKSGKVDSLSAPIVSKT